MHTLARKEVTMPRPKVFVTRRIDADALKSLEPHVDLNIWEGWFPPDREQFLAPVSYTHLTLPTTHYV